MLTVRSDIGVLHKWPTSWSITLVIVAAPRIFRGPLARQLKQPAAFGVLGAMACLLVTAESDGKNNALMYLVGGPVTAVSTVLMTSAAARWRGSPAVLVPLQVLGVISYSVYLWNYLIGCRSAVTAPAL